MLPGYLERRPVSLTPEQVEQLRGRVADALHEYRTREPGAVRSTRPVYRRWQAVKTHLLG
jgi:hypothetical protein